MKKKIWRANQIGYMRAAKIDKANRRRQQKRRGVSKEGFRQALMEMAARREVKS